MICLDTKVRMVIISLKKMELLILYILRIIQFTMNQLILILFQGSKQWSYIFSCKETKRQRGIFYVIWQARSKPKSKKHKQSIEK